MILLPETTLSGTLSVAENIRSTIEKSRIKRLDTGESIKRVTVSVGVVQHAQGESADEPIDRADAALYRSKSKGRNWISTDDCGLITQIPPCLSCKFGESGKTPYQPFKPTIETGTNRFIP